MQPPRSSYLPLPLMHLSFLFTGAGTILLGPTLPVFAQHWHLRDAQSGLIIAASFLGLCSGAISVSRNLRLTLLRGYLIAAAAFLMLALTSNRPGGYPAGIFAVYLLGLGLGQVTTSVNLIAAVRYQAPWRRSSALSLLNFTWSVGAVLSPLVAGFSLAHASLFALLIGFSIFATLLLTVMSLLTPAIARSSEPTPAALHKLALLPLAYFFAIFFLYGGLEAALGGWLSTYTLRYTSLGIAAAAYSTTALWAAFAVGRALAAVLLRSIPERPLRTAGVLLATLATVALRGAHTGLGVGICAACIGLGIGPFFPVTFSQLVAQAPSPRQAGAATANVGLGSAVFAYLTGVISTRMGSLHSAMITPVLIAVGILVLCAINIPGRHETST